MAAPGWPIWPETDSLAQRWESHGLIREQMRSCGKILLWDSPQATGVASKATLTKNRFAIQVLLEVWLGHVDLPKSPCVQWLKKEVGDP